MFLGVLCLFLLVVVLVNGNDILRQAGQIYEEEIEFTNEDNIVLVGRLFSPGNKDLAVVLAHSGVLGEDQEGLHPLARGLAERGISALTFDFQGIGKTGGEVAFTEVDRDVKGAVTLLREKGYSRIACMGVGIGGTACAKNAPDGSLVGMVLVSAPTDISTAEIIEEPELEVVLHQLEITAEDLARLGYPILIIAAENDMAAGRSFAEMARAMYGYAADPKEIVIFPGSYHSMDLFRSEYGEEIYKRVYEFFDRIQ